MVMMTMMMMTMMIIMVTMVVVVVVIRGHNTRRAYYPASYGQDKPVFRSVDDISDEKRGH